MEFSTFAIVHRDAFQPSNFHNVELFIVIDYPSIKYFQTI